jgi:predicted nuclease with TOPRIM domain
MTTTFRKKLNHYERENIDAVSKLRIIEPQLEKHESELKRLKKDNERLEKKNRVLMETERVYKKGRWSILFSKKRKALYFLI